MEYSHDTCIARALANYDQELTPEQRTVVERWLRAYYSEQGQAALELCHLLSTSPNLIG